MYFPESDRGRLYNETGVPVSSSYTGQQWTTPLLGYSSEGSAQDRYDPNFINERENFFHKPIAKLKLVFSII